MRAHGSLVDRLGSRERGDVPAWVLITVMTAGLVVVLWGVAGQSLQEMFNNAMESVTGPGSGS
ncbi:hypothetical protein [Motilibacter aurantiacus]|uniref:hypothetical protein n=1 Tax=Motilibacter aurantiacus TaxID=2714955 RepID=UPI0014082AF9|nr:hypothetical protein [Motilibacter aurantiacus]